MGIKDAIGSWLQFDTNFMLHSLGPKGRRRLKVGRKILTGGRS